MHFENSTNYKSGEVSAAVVGPSGPRAELHVYAEYHQVGEITETTVCETPWSAIVTSFERNYDDLIAGHPDCTEEIELLRNLLLTVLQLIHLSPSVNGKGAVWKELIAIAEAERTVPSEHLNGKALFTAMLRLYAAIHREMLGPVLPEQKESNVEFRGQRRRKGNPQKKKQTNRKNRADA
jgi:hypothetical protein